MTGRPQLWWFRNLQKSLNLVLKSWHQIGESSFQFGRETKALCWLGQPKVDNMFDNYIINTVHWQDDRIVGGTSQLKYWIQTHLTPHTSHLTCFYYEGLPALLDAVDKSTWLSPLLIHLANIVLEKNISFSLICLYRDKAWYVVASNKTVGKPPMWNKII